MGVRREPAKAAPIVEPFKVGRRPGLPTASVRAFPARVVSRPKTEIQEVLRGPVGPRIATLDGALKVTPIVGVGLRRRVPEAAPT